MSFVKMGMRLLNKRRLRTILTMIAIMLGVGILTGVNVTADSIETAINAQINAKLGNNDIIVRGNRSINGGWFQFQTAKTMVQAVAGVKTIVPRIAKSHASYPYLNQTSGWNVMTYGLDTEDPEERKFGSSNLTAALNASFVNTSRMEELLYQYRTVELPIVISQNYAKAFNLTPGETLYIYSENAGKLGKSMSAQNTTTWLNATIVGIMIDASEAVQDFMPPADLWELYPPSTAVYLDINKAWHYIFNNHENQVNMLFVHIQDPTEIDTIRSNIEKLNNNNVFPGGIFTENVKGLFTEGILQVNFLMRGIFSIFSGISLLVCAIIIKNLLEMSKEEQMKEIGVMRAIGVTKGKILLLYMTQILFLSLIGSLMGLVFGYFLSSIFVGSYVNTAAAVGTDFAAYEIAPVMSSLTVAIGMGAGIGVCVVFGFFPARAASNVDPLEALRANTDRPQDSLLKKTIKETGNFSISLTFTIVGIILIGSAFGGLFLLDIVNPRVIAMLFIGVILLILGIVFLAAFFFPVIIPAISTLFTPLLQKMRTITSRNLTRYSRQTKNTFAMLSIGLCMMITVGTIMNSAYAGAYPGGRTVVGGDLQIGDFYNGHVPKDPHAQGLRDLPSVSEAVPVRFSIGFEGLTRIDRIAEDRTFGGIADSALGKVRESFHLGIIDPIEYAKLHSRDSIVRISTSKATLSSIMTQLDQPYTVALQDRLARRMGGIKEGERVRIRFEGFEAEFTVIGIFEVLPGFYWTYYTADNANEKQFAGAISWKTYEQLVNDNIGKIDLVARNKVNPPEEYKEYIPQERLWGYASTPLDYTALESLMAQTGLVKSESRRTTSAFYGIPTFKWHTNLTSFDKNAEFDTYSAPLPNSTSSAYKNVVWYQPGSINETWNPMMSRAQIFDQTSDRGFGNTSIERVLPQVPTNKNRTVEDVFDWTATALPGTNVCAVNEMYVNYNITTGKMDYIKRFVPGDTIRMYYNETIYSDFLVVATTNSHYNYEISDAKGNHHGDTAVFNYKALSFNTYTYNTTDWNYFFEVLDVEPNSILIPKSGFSIPEIVSKELIPSLIPNSTGNYSGGGQSGLTIDPAISWWINQTLENVFLLNSTAYNGTIDSNQWTGNYTFNGTNIQFDGVQITIGGQEQNISINLDFVNGTQILDELAAGNLTLYAENFTSALYFDLDDRLTLEDIDNLIQTLNALCKSIPTLQDVLFFSPKRFFIEESKMFHVFYWIGATSKDKIEAAYLEIENYYLSHDLPWDPDWVKKATDMEKQVGGILGLIVNMFFGVLAFALIVSLLGLAISTVISIKKRYAEIGTLRTFGFGNRQIMQMVVGEGVITATLGIIVGIITGLLIAGLIILNLPFMIFLPIVFTPPLELIGLGVGALLLASIGASFLPAISAVKIDIADAIRTKGE